MDFLLYWSTPAQIALIVAVFGGGSVLGLCIVRKLVPVDRLQKNHEVAGVTFGVLGAFYGLVLAFVIVAAWERFDVASTNTHDEAISLEILYRFGLGFSEPMRSRLDSAVVNYTKEVINVEWPQMAAMGYDASNAAGTHGLWSIVLSYRPADAREQMLLDKAIGEVSEISQARSLRTLFYGEDLPSVVWFVIYLGCVITISFGYFFGNNLFRAQVTMCFSFSVLLGVTILAILELAHPYQGVVTISDQPFRFALARMLAAGKAAAGG